MKNGEIINVNGKRVIFFRDEEGCSGCAFQNDSSCPEDCDYGKFFELPNPWHTGTPTEEGNYLLRLRHANMKFDTANFRNGKFMSYHNHRHDPEDIIKWQKIEPYEDDA